jgi:Cu(I)/Ag(I) efflux system membrane fusion protein
MKKTILLMFVSLVLGIGATVLVLANPFEWEWMHAAGHALLGGGDAAEAEAGEKQLWTCGMHPQVIQDEPGDCPICGMKLVPVRPQPASAAAGSGPAGERKVKYWQAPMDPTYIRDEPGQSPMGMDLVPVYEDEAGEAPAGTVQIDPVFVQNIGVQSQPLERRDIPFTVRTVGTLTYNEKGTYLITTKYEGWIENVHVNYVGEPVKKGQKLFEVYSPKLVTTQEEYLQSLDYARRMAEGRHPDIAARAQSLLDSTRQRLRYWDISDEQIQQLEESGQVARTLSVVAPARGFIVEKMNQALEGMYVRPGMNLYKVADLSTIWVEVDIFENQVSWMRVGQKATIELPYQPGKTYTGTVKYLYPYFDKKTRTMKVSIELSNPGHKLRAEMYANVTLEMPSVQDVLAVPEEAVIHSGQRNVVVLDRGNGTFQVKEVTLGVNGDGVWEVKQGLEEGDSIVTSAQFLIDSESNLQEAIQKMVAKAKGSGEPEPPAESAGHQH